ncbi:MAG: hypothetical protein K0Q53_2116 [Massilibacillus sp.]|nr:hypothetical protein [Massilibacillus sp.]
MGKVSLHGVIDMHVHSAPDIRERAYSDFELMEAGIKVGARAIVIKSHHGTTMNRAYLTNEHNKIMHQNGNNFTMFGSITLNAAIGGLNPIAVETGLKMGAKIVWLPTTSAENHLKQYGKTGGIACLNNGKIVKPLKEIFKMIKDYNAVLGTGHLAPAEIFPIVEQAKAMGLDKIVITHPEFWVVGMSHEDQVKITKDYNVYLERCYAQPMGGGVYRNNLEDNLTIINKVGYENIIVDTDGGQVENPHWEIALENYMQFLADHGIPENQIDVMTKKTPAKLLGIAN